MLRYVHDILSTELEKEPRTCVKLSAYHHTRELNFSWYYKIPKTIFIIRRRHTCNEEIVLVRIDKNISFYSKIVILKMEQGNEHLWTHVEFLRHLTLICTVILLQKWLSNVLKMNWLLKIELYKELLSS